MVISFPRFECHCAPPCHAEARLFFHLFLIESIDNPLPFVYNISRRLENRGYAPLAQLVEHLTLNQGVQGSSP